MDAPMRKREEFSSGNFDQLDKSSSASWSWRMWGTRYISSSGFKAIGLVSNCLRGLNLFKDEKVVQNFKTPPPPLWKIIRGFCWGSFIASFCDFRTDLWKRVRWTEKRSDNFFGFLLCVEKISHDSGKNCWKKVRRQTILLESLLSRRR